MDTALRVRSSRNTECNTLSEWTITLDGGSISYEATENSTHTSLLFKHAEGNRTVEIAGAELVPTNPLDWARPMIFVIVVAISSLIVLAGLL